LVWMGCATGAFAADPPPAPHPEKTCTTLEGDARAECERVAKKLVESAKNPKGPDDAKAVGMHSSPVMIDEKERAIVDAERKGKDPRKAVEKIEAKENPPAK
jgi:hypothetical protein